MEIELDSLYVVNHFYSIKRISKGVSQITIRRGDKSLLADIYLHSQSGGIHEAIRGMDFLKCYAFYDNVIKNEDAKLIEVIKRTIIYFENLGKTEIDTLRIVFGGSFFRIEYIVTGYNQGFKLLRSLLLSTYFDMYFFGETKSNCYDTMSLKQISGVHPISQLLDMDKSLNFYIDNRGTSSLNSKSYETEDLTLDVDTGQFIFRFSSATIRKMISREYLYNVTDLPRYFNQKYNIESNGFFTLGTTEAEIRTAKVLLYKLTVFSGYSLIYVKDVDIHSKIIILDKNKTIRRSFKS